MGSLLVRAVWADDGAPAADIGLKLHQSGATDFYRDVLVARTSEDGTVLLESVIPGRVSAHSDRGVSGSAQVRAGERAELELALPMGFSIRGVVRDVDGTPVTGADVYLWGCHDNPDQGFVVAKSGAQGAYSVRGLDADGLNFLSARAPWRAPTRQRLVMASEGAEVTADLQFEVEGGAIEGRVITSDGSPVEGATIVVGATREWVSVPRFPDGAEAREPAGQRVFTDALGSFRVDGVAAGAIPVEARSPGRAPWRREVEVLAGRARAIDVVLEVGPRLEGTVRNDRGEPVARAEVTIGDGVSLDGAYRQTLADGSFEFDATPIGEFEIRAASERGGNAQATLVGVAGETQSWDAVLTRGLVLRARVEAPGTDLVQWSIEVRERRGGVDAFYSMSSADEDGRFEVLDCPESALDIELYGPHSGPWPRAVVEDVRAGMGEILLRPDPGTEPSVRLRGRVVLADGEPCGEAKVSPLLSGANLSPIESIDIETGRFELGPYPPGRWRMRAHAPGFADLTSEERTLEADATWDLGDLVMQRGGTVVVDWHREEGVETGEPALMLMSPSGAHEWFEYVDEVARSRPLLPGGYTLIIGGKGIALAAEPVEVQEGEETRLSINLKRGYPVRLTFAGADDRPLEESIEFTLRDAAGRTLSASTLAYGLTPLEWSTDLLPGRYRFRAWTTTGRSGELELVVGESAAEHTLRIE